MYINATYEVGSVYGSADFAAVWKAGNDVKPWPYYSAWVVTYQAVCYAAWKTSEPAVKRLLEGSGLGDPNQIDQASKKFTELILIAWTIRNGDKYLRLAYRVALAELNSSNYSKKDIKNFFKCFANNTWEKANFAGNPYILNIRILFDSNLNLIWALTTPNVNGMLPPPI